MIACLGETTGVPTLETIHHQMQNSEEGCQILAEKPRINTSTVDLEALKKLPQNTFGYHYATFLEKYVNATKVPKIPTWLAILKLH